MRISGIGNSKRRADAEVEPAVLDAVEEHCRALRQLLRAADEPRQRRTGEEDSSRGIQALNVEWRHLARGPTEEHHRPQRLDRRQRRIKRVLTDTVIRDVDAFTIGELLDLRRDVDALTVEEHLIRAGLA